MPRFCGVVFGEGWCGAAALCSPRGERVVGSVGEERGRWSQWELPAAWRRHDTRRWEGRKEGGGRSDGAGGASGRRACFSGPATATATATAGGPSGTGWERAGRHHGAAGLCERPRVGREAAVVVGGAGHRSLLLLVPGRLRAARFRDRGKASNRGRGS